MVIFINMSNYFSKWMIADDVIRKNDYVWVNDYDGNYKVDRIKDGLIEVLSIGWCFRDECTRVKPFLCSRDITLTDEVYCRETLKKRRIDLKIQSLEKYKEKGYFKVIGEISDEAYSYILDDTNINDEDIERWAVIDSVGILGRTPDEAYQPAVYKIACPTCKHFH